MKNYVIVVIIILTLMTCGDKKIEVDFYVSGDTLSVYSLENGIKNGKFKVLFQNGNVRQEGNYVNGLKDGIFKTYFENGDLSEYFVYSNDTLIYLTNFDETGKVIGSALGIKISKLPREKRIYDFGDTIHFGYTLMHSMVENPIIGLDVVRFAEHGPDTIESLFQSSKDIEYDLIDYEIGKNNFALTVYEVDPFDTTFLGWQVDTISFEVLP